MIQVKRPSDDVADARTAWRRWNDGWLRAAQRSESPNFEERPTDACIDLIVLHSISLPPGEYGGDQVLRLFANKLDWSAHPYFEKIHGARVSAHFFVRRDGALWQCVSCDDRAWHAGTSRYRGRDNCNDDSIGIELEGLEGESFEPAQYRALADLCRAIGNATRYGTWLGTSTSPRAVSSTRARASTGNGCVRRWNGMGSAFRPTARM